MADEKSPNLEALIGKAKGEVTRQKRIMKSIQTTNSWVACAPQAAKPDDPALTISRTSLRLCTPGRRFRNAGAQKLNEALLRVVTKAI